MVHMLKCDLALNRGFIEFVIFFIPIIYLLNLEPIYMYSGLMMGICFNTFYSNAKDKANRFIVSLPISKFVIVSSRYIFFLSVIAGCVIYQGLIDILIHEWLPSLQMKPLTIMSIGWIFIIISIATAIALPIYYMCRSFMMATVIIFSVLLIVAFSLGMLSAAVNDVATFFSALNNMVSYPWMLISILITLVCTVLSFQLSLWIFRRSDQI
ncbi:ABC-2 transporter permease [Lentibacillus sp. N15]|uniref:ABC-2 transporter permease n=1 Tax=Lentibacillus songyuanensis TaxID=3136161 RepID=UPI0031BABE42